MLINSRILSITSDDDGSGNESDDPKVKAVQPSGNALQPVDVEVVSLEKKIYLKAALRLLDLRDQSIEEKHRYIRGRLEGTSTDLIKFGKFHGHAAYSVDFTMQAL